MSGADHRRLDRAAASIALLFLAAGCPAQDAATSGGGGDGGDDGVLCEDRIDAFASGKLNLTGVYGYDAEGRTLRYVETLPDGEEVFRVTRAYDARGRRARQDVEDHRLGAPRRAVTWEYDEQDRVVRTVYERMDEETEVSETRYIWDAAGRLERVEQDSNGAPRRVDRYRFTEGEPLVLEIAADSPVDGEDDWRYRYHFAMGRWLTRIERVDAGEVGTSEVYTYSDLAKGQLSRRDFDIDGDREIDSIDHFSWNEAGLLEHAGYDTNADGVLNQTLGFTYDASGRMVERAFWSGEAGGPFEWLTTFTWDEDGLVSASRDDVPTAQKIESWSIERGCAGERVMDVNIVPVHGWRQELIALPFVLDLSAWFGFPDAL